MSAASDRLSALLATASPGDASVGQRILSALVAAETALATVKSEQVADTSAYDAARITYTAALLVATTAAARASRAAANSTQPNDDVSQAVAIANAQLRSLTERPPTSPAALSSAPELSLAQSEVDALTKRANAFSDYLAVP